MPSFNVVFEVWIEANHGALGSHSHWAPHVRYFCFQNRVVHAVFCSFVPNFEIFLVYIHMLFKIIFLFIAFSAFISKVSVITRVYISWSQVQILVQEVADLQWASNSRKCSFTMVVLGVCLLWLPEPYAYCGTFSYTLVSQRLHMTLIPSNRIIFYFTPLLLFYSAWVQSLCKRVLVINKAAFKYSICFVDATVEVTTLI